MWVRIASPHLVVLDLLNSAFDRVALWRVCESVSPSSNFGISMGPSFRNQQGNNKNITTATTDDKTMDQPKIRTVANPKRGDKASNSRKETGADHAAADVSKTRLCIKNIPSHYQANDLRKFIQERIKASQQKQQQEHIAITDCRILQTKQGVSRRMAFVGIAAAAGMDPRNTKTTKTTEDDSAAATERVRLLLDRTYCGTSKLAVEYATLPPSTPSKSTSSIANETDAQQEQQKDSSATTTASKAETKKDQKRKEFLAVMGVGGFPSAKAAAADNMDKRQSGDVHDGSRAARKIWANDDEDDDELDVMKSEKTVRGEGLMRPQSENTDSKADGTDDDVDDTDDDDDDSTEPLSSSKPPIAAQSAMDFLRSKQVATDELEHSTIRSHGTTGGTDDSDNATAVHGVTNRDSHVDNTDPIDNEDEICDDQDEIYLMKDPENVSSIRPKKQEIKIEITPQNEQQRSDTDEEDARRAHEDQDGISQISNRIFLRNLPFTATEDDVREHLQSYGTIAECHVSVDDRKQSKGFAFVTFASCEAAQAALSKADGRDFQGRLLHILPARCKPTTSHHDDTSDPSKAVSYKDKMDRKRQHEATSTQKGWLASFVRGDVVVDNLAVRLGLRKGDIMSVKDGLSSGEAAVRLALGETAVIEENRTYFADHGIDMEALVSLGGQDEVSDSAAYARSKTAILVKNLPHDTNKDDLKQIFQGNDVSILLPPSRTIAVVQYTHANDAKLAFRKHAYRRFKSVPLYLEWVPLAASQDIVLADKPLRDEEIAESLRPVNETVESATVDDGGPTSSIYVKNLSFATSEEQLSLFFAKQCKGVRVARIPQKMSTTRPLVGETPISQSMGYGFVEFTSTDSAQNALKRLQGSMLDGHAIELKISSGRLNKLVTSSPSSTEGLSGKGRCKLMVRNVPFQATRKELLQLFGSFGSLKKVRLPKKFDGSHRGFAFIEYLTDKEATNAMKVLSRTHLYGRHLVIEHAAADEEVEDIHALRDKAERDVTLQKRKRLRST